MSRGSGRNARTQRRWPPPQQPPRRTRDPDFGPLPLTNVVGWGAPHAANRDQQNRTTSSSYRKRKTLATAPCLAYRRRGSPAPTCAPSCSHIGAFVADPIPDLHAHLWGFHRRTPDLQRSAPRRPADRTPVYRPTVHYAYCPSDVAVSSVLELRMRNWQMQSHQRILNDEITSGSDELGVLLMGHPFGSWWTGSLLSIEEARAIVGHQNATTLQVAGSIIAAVTWMIEHPNEGVCVPDDLPWREVLKVASPYLGTMHSAASDWDPLTTRNDLFPTFADDTDRLDLDDPWQFGNFLVG